MCTCMLTFVLIAVWCSHYGCQYVTYKAAKVYNNTIASWPEWHMTGFWCLRCLRLSVVRLAVFCYHGEIAVFLCPLCSWCYVCGFIGGWIVYSLCGHSNYVRGICMINKRFQVHTVTCVLLCTAYLTSIVSKPITSITLQRKWSSQFSWLFLRLWNGTVR